VGKQKGASLDCLAQPPRIITRINELLVKNQTFHLSKNKTART
jgi:hypothetical protein